MSTEKIYETDRKKPYAEADPAQTVSRSLYGAVVRNDGPLNCGFGEVVEIAPPSEGDAPVHVHIDTVPQETIAKSPDSAARAASLMLALSNDGTRGQLGFRVEYPAD